MTTATEITTALTDVLGAVDEAKDMVEDLHDDLETTLTHARRGQMQVEALGVVDKLLSLMHAVDRWLSRSSRPCGGFMTPR